MSLADQILRALSESGPLDDDELAERLHVVRQQVNQAARRLEQRGVVRRYRGPSGKLVNAMAARDSAEPPPQPTADARPAAPESERAERSGLLLVACVKTKSAQPAPAKDLYQSNLFRKERSYAERSGLPWFILSAEHGLVAPNEWLAPYERYLPDTPRSFRRAWGVWVVERLKLLTGSLTGRSVEVHASSEYVDALRSPLAEAGAELVEPLRGLSLGDRLAWYGRQSQTQAEPAVPSLDELVARLSAEPSASPLSDLIERGSEGLRVPGLYSWWVDAGGAAELSDGLGHSIEPGLIYAGLAGATRWPSGTASANTLWSRITSMHLGRRHTASTLRLSLGSVLAAAREWSEIDESELTAWMLEHLKVVLVPFPDADTLGSMEGGMLARLEPPLNLQGRPPTAVRARLTELRRRYSAKK